MKHVIGPILFLLVALSASVSAAEPPYRLYMRSLFTPVLPDFTPQAKEAETDGLAWHAARGEFEPAVLVVQARQALQGLRVATTDLRGPDGALVPATNIRAQQILAQKVKVGPRDKKREVVVPEWVVSLPETGVTLAAGTSTSICLTVHVPKDAPAGSYQGSARILTEGYMPHEIRLTLQVRPFALTPARVTYAMLYTYEFRYLERWDEKYQPARKRRTSGKAEFLAHGKAMVRDLAEHGMTCIFPHSSRVLLEDEAGLRTPDLDMSMKTARAFGMHAAPGWFVGHLLNAQWKDLKHFQAERDGQRLNRIIRLVGTRAKAYGFPYGIVVPADEPKKSVPEKLRVARQLLEAAQDEAKRSGVRLAVTSDYETLKAIPDLYQIAIIAGGTPEEWADIRKSGHTLWIYDNNSATGHNPSWSRFMYGFYGWRCAFDGISSWTYPLNIGPWSGRKRQDLAGNPIPSYDAAGRPINTVVWEAIREGTEDRRYVDTLSAAIARARTAGNKAGADKAQKILDDLRAEIDPHLTAYGYLHTEYGDPTPGERLGPAWFTKTRQRMAEAIASLQGK